jgi:mRNA interferase RelE/StbE
MAEYNIFFKQSAVKDLDPIPKKDLQRIIRRIRLLKENPRPPGCEKLSARERYRIRQGKYRIVYSIQDDQLIVWVVKISHRRDVYR